MSSNGLRSKIFFLTKSLIIRIRFFKKKLNLNNVKQTLLISKIQANKYSLKPLFCDLGAELSLNHQ
jgi:hypothetical protein